MLTKWKVANFKCFEKETEIDLAPLTVLTGLNSCGKSSFIHSMLMIAQTMRHKDKTQPVILNGEFCELYSFADIKNNKSDSDSIDIDFSIDGSNTIRCNFSFVDDKIDPIRTQLEKTAIFSNAEQQLSIAFNWGVSNDIDPFSISEEQDIDDRPDCYGEEGVHSYHGYQLDTKDHKKIDIYHKSSDDDVLGRIGNYLNYQVSKKTVQNTGDDLTVHGCKMENFIPQRFFMTKYYPSLDKHIGKIYDLPNEISTILNKVKSIFCTKFHYLGPLREEPNFIQKILLSGDVLDVGKKGENTAYVLANYHNTPEHEFFTYISPQVFETTSLKKIEPINPQDYNTPFSEAVSKWLKYLGIANTVTAKYENRANYSIIIDEKYDLSQVGVGVSQVLPIVVMCLAAEKGSTIIIEQPELHLHPTAQSKLGDFFLSVAKLGKQCIIETHSEDLIDALRYNVVATSGSDETGENGEIVNETSKLIKIYFPEDVDGYATFHPIRIKTNGTLSEWPKGFFDESHNKARQIILKAAEKRKRTLPANEDGND